MLIGRCLRDRQLRVVLVLLVAALLYQVVRIAPYTPFHSEEVPSSGACPATHRIRYMVANVLQDNRDSRALLATVKRWQPDVLLLTETDRWWAEEVAPLRQGMPHGVAVPLSNTYGMILLSRLRLDDAHVRYLVEPDVPSIRAAVLSPAGERIELHAVHPKPPQPGQDTAERDAELVMVGREVRRLVRPTIVAGDLNDVAWSDTTNLFQEVSGLRDPRVGRGFYATFPQDLPFLRWPLDYVFVSPGFEFIGMRLLEDMGSDHLPVIFELCTARLSRAAIAPSTLPGDVKQEAAEKIEEGKAEAQSPK